MSSRKWLNCRLSDIQERLGSHRVSRPVISRLLKVHHYCLRVNTKQICSQQDPERNEQFEHIQEQRRQHQEAGEPHISTDTKKKELIGNFRNPGRVWCQTAERVNVHDFKQDALGTAVPYGVYDLQFNHGTVVDHGRSCTVLNPPESSCGKGCSRCRLSCTRKASSCWLHHRCSMTW